MRPTASWETADLLALKKRVERFGIELCGIAAYWKYDKCLRNLPDRENEIAYWKHWIRITGEAGIPVIQYNWTINAGGPFRNWRTSVTTTGRGGAQVASFDYELAKNVPATSLGHIDEAQMWAGLISFLQEVTPVAEEAGVRLALHPSDPQVPALAGIARIMRSSEAYDRLFAEVPSRANAMTFCQGCFAQILDAEQLYPAILHFGTAGRIALVHFRNVEGRLENFREMYWDEGKVDNRQAMRAYREAGYNGYFVIDHFPHMPSDTKQGHQARAFAIGYTRAMIQCAS
jgi:mannonate dehydratase